MLLLARGNQDSLSCFLNVVLQAFPDLIMQMQPSVPHFTVSVPKCSLGSWKCLIIVLVDHRIDPILKVEEAQEKMHASIPGTS